MKTDGRLVIIDNREIEKVSVFVRTRTGTFVLDKSLNGGTEVADLISEATKPVFGD